jgi:uncharacterized membrane protein HdeD (DUF308 family)
MTTATTTTDTVRPLRRLYGIRFGFALVWAVLLVVTASLTAPALGPVSATLLVLYPLFDVAAAIVDVRSSGAGRSAPGLWVNVVISGLAAVGLLVAVMSGIPAVLGVWGAWAVVAGLVQLVVAIRRRALGGQWAMIASGSISVLAGVSFVVMAANPGATLTSVAGYALLGGIFFLVSALGLGRAARRRA